MYTFRDYYNNEVKLSFRDHPYSKEPMHVLVICTYNNQWLLTSHSDRGLEFPGGKVEEGETAEAAAVREVKEETGGVVNEIRYIAQYLVAGKGATIVKNVYFATIKTLTKQPTYYETDGPVVKKQLPHNVMHHHLYSFIMKDDVLTHCMNYIKENIKNRP